MALYQLQHDTKETFYNIIFNTELIENICEWVKNNLNYFYNDLNELYSCEVEIFQGNILITGDEDYITLIIRPLNEIKL